jgi:hypothetical protein
MDASQMISKYVTDFGTTIENLGIKILNGYAAKLTEEYTARKNSLCSNSHLFRPRALVATFADGTKVRYPVGERKNLIARAKKLIESKAVCVDYEGEYWPYVPSTLLGVNYRSSAMEGFSSSGKKTVGSFSYTSDILGDIVQTFAFEAVPEELLKIAVKCLKDVSLSSGGFCKGSRSINIKARRFRGKGFVKGNIKRIYTRDIKLSGQDPTECGKSNAPYYYCLSYIGESIKNVHLLLPKQGGGGGGSRPRLPALPGA